MGKEERALNGGVRATHLPIMARVSAGVKSGPMTTATGQAEKMTAFPVSPVQPKPLWRGGRMSRHSHMIG